MKVSHSADSHDRDGEAAGKKACSIRTFSIGVFATIVIAMMLVDMPGPVWSLTLEMVQLTPVQMSVPSVVRIPTALCG